MQGTSDSQIVTIGNLMPLSSQNCHARPVYVDERRVHDYCGRTCAQLYQDRLAREDMQAQGNVHIIYPHPRVQPSFVDRRVQPSFAEPLVQPSFVDPRAQPDFAVPRIRPEFVDPLVQPDFAVPREYDGVGQTGTSNSVSSADPRRGAYADMDNSGVSVLEEIPSSQEEFQEISVFFRAMWKHQNKPKPSTLAKLYRVHSDAAHLARFQAYKTATGNARKRWHGTRRTCRVGDDAARLGCCRDAQCATCQILQHAFRLPPARGGRTGFHRFGRGLYTSATTSKAADYATSTARSSPYVALILCEVVMGRVYPMAVDARSGAQVPGGYDSVVGVPGVTLNYDEAVVYREDAIRPEYLVLFEVA
ncbi:hypothetical protein PsYK624_039420 [Phanerochaete sordida]|uniref:PARP catalytic domain-containing protein n=1 Tax=Phanerochaete sordida TaxID=48140 RepID=A0A9P3G2J7_9APHY|nr:hypothetical protein PsYK624_039420 [Phanerochaete sordida]